MESPAPGSLVDPDPAVTLEQVRERIGCGEPLRGELAVRFHRAVAALDPAATAETLGELTGARGVALYPGILSVAGLRAGERVVDIGCGVGTLTRWAATIVGEQGRVDGVDNCPAAVVQAAARTDERFPSAQFWTADAAALTWIEDGAADCVLASLVLDQVVALGDVLAEAARVLRPGGRLVGAAVAFDELGPADRSLWAECIGVVARHASGALSGRASIASFPDDDADLAAFRAAGLHTPETRSFGIVARMPDADAAWRFFSRSYLGYVLPPAGAHELAGVLARAVPCTFTVPIRVFKSGRTGGVRGR